MRYNAPFTPAVAFLAFAFVPATAAEKNAVETEAADGGFFPALQKFLERRTAEFDRIPADRKADLEKIAGHVKSRVEAGEPARLVFVCTHNSRRSQMSQVWAAAAASYYRVGPVESYSGGTEATAFNPRAVAALERAGIQVKKTDDGANPRYAVRFREKDRPLICFSKTYTCPANPKKDFCAVMVCSQADEKCPKVEGASLRIPLSFDDPKIADDTPEETERYDERCAQIAREYLYLFSQVSR